SRPVDARCVPVPWRHAGRVARARPPRRRHPRLAGHRPASRLGRLVERRQRPGAARRGAGRDLRRYVNLRFLKTAADILSGKKSRLLTIDAGVSVLEAARQMIEANVGSMLVTVEGQITGIVTERDYLRRVVLEEKGDRETTV